MNYLLVENRNTNPSVLLGPILWKQRFIQSELDDMDIVYKIPPIEQGYIKINDNLEIIPIVEDTTLAYDSLYEELAGPFYVYTDNTASMSYAVIPRSLDNIKLSYYQMTAAERYRKEVSGITVVIQNTSVTIDTARNTRDVFVQQYLLMPDLSTTAWKFPQCWLTLTKSDLGACVAAGVAHIQSAFDWEKSIVDAINVAADVATLKLIVIVPVPVTVPVV